MNKTFSSGFLHERVVFFSFFFILIVLSLDCFFQNLLVSGYGLVVITLILIGCTTCITCHAIKWIINCNKPLQFYLSEKSENEKWLKLLMKYEDNIFNTLFSKENKLFDSFKYPTNLNEQIRLLIKDLEKNFVKTWYCSISQNPSFLFDSHLILEEIFFKIIKKLKTISCKSIILNILILYLNHLQEYKKSIKKMSRMNENESKPKIELPDLCQYSHPGSQSDQILNYYLKKVTKSFLKEFASYDFAITLECKILGYIISRKVFRRLLTTAEDPDWINFKLIYLLNSEKHKEIFGNKIYTVKEKAVLQEEDEFRFKKPALLSQGYLSSNIFESHKNLFYRDEFKHDGHAKLERREMKGKLPEKELLTLPLCIGKTPLEENKGNISTVLSNLISSTAGPLLPDNISVRYKAFNKLWQSPVSDVKKDISETISNSFQKVFDGMKDKKGIFRSKSTEALAEIPGSMKTKDISVGEELCENIRLGPAETHKGLNKAKKLIKTRSFDNDSLLTENDEYHWEKVTLERESSSFDNNHKDVSPVYEETEDFATTIAKLRSLLQQRESNSTLSDKSNLSVDSQTGFPIDKSDCCKFQSSEGDPFNSQIACDIPTDGRLFVNVSIPKGELVTDSSSSSYVLYTIQYDGIYMLKDERNPSSDSELVLQTTVVKRRFQDFLRLQAKLEENSNYKTLMKGVKKPSKWLQLNFGGKNDDSTTSSRRAILESFLRQLCSKVEISNSQELHEFLGYGHSGNDDFVKKDSSSSLQRIDKLLANKVTGVFNSIKTALPSFDFDSTALVATNDTVKSFQEQKIIQNFLNFGGNKTEPFELKLNFIVKDPSGDSLTDDIRHYFSEKSDCIEDAVDVLDSNDWFSEQRECRFISADEKCVWQGYKDVVLDDELEPLDSWLPIYSLLLDIICELLQDCDSWATKEPVIRLAKVISGHWEEKFQKELTNFDWDRIFANVIRVLRGVVFSEDQGENLEMKDLETKKILRELILDLIPDWITEFVKPEGVSSAVCLFVNSFQHSRLNRDVLLRLADILLTHLLSCHHLTVNYKR